MPFPHAPAAAVTALYATNAIHNTASSVKKPPVLPASPYMSTVSHAIVLMDAQNARATTTTLVQECAYPATKLCQAVQTAPIFPLVDNVKAATI
jgi:hypothetical protein